MHFKDLGIPGKTAFVLSLLSVITGGIWSLLNSGPLSEQLAGRQPFSMLAYAWFALTILTTVYALLYTMLSIRRKNGLRCAWGAASLLIAGVSLIWIMQFLRSGILQLPLIQ